MGWSKTACLATIALGFLPFLESASRADEIADFYRGKNVELQIGFGPGGGNDVWGRMVSRHMPRHLPGNPTFVPKNVPAAGSLVVANTLYNSSPKDGSAIGMIARGIPFEPLFGGKGTQFDALKFNYLGSPSRDSNMCAVWHTHPVKTAKDLFTVETVIGSTGSGAESHVFPILLENLLGMKIKIIKGYKGSQDIMLAIERRELDGICLGTETVRRTSQYQGGKFRIVLQMATEPDPGLGDLPLVTEFAKSPEDRAALDLIFARVDVGRPFVAPPGVPPERVAALRKAFTATMNDKDFQKDIAEVKFEINAITGEQLEGLIRKAYATPPAVVARTAGLLSQ
jgi:tripartite-type tricarboxylate transporter receptor subunit TctC